jgi:molybdopterin converting factor small subunit
MKVTVKVIGPFIYKAGFSERDIEMMEPATVKDLLLRVNINGEGKSIVLRNGKSVSMSDMLADGDRVVISPIYSGG